jgi:hypothetical protein
VQVLGWLPKCWQVGCTELMGLPDPAPAICCTALQCNTRSIGEGPKFKFGGKHAAKVEEVPGPGAYDVPLGTLDGECAPWTVCVHLAATGGVHHSVCDAGRGAGHAALGSRYQRVAGSGCVVATTLALCVLVAF